MKVGRLVVALVVWLCGFSSQAADVTIAALRSRDIPPYNLAMKGFEEALTRRGITPWIVPYTIDEKSTSAEDVIGEIRRKKPQLVLALGTKATEAAGAGIHDIPIVFSVILNPGAELLRADNMTGSLMDIPFSSQFKVLKSVLPKAKTVGILYSPAETGSVVEEAAAAARIEGLSLQRIPVQSEREVPDRLREAARNIDVLWMVADSTVYTPKSTEYILQYTLGHQIPFVGISAKYVKAGALFAVSWDYADLGQQAGEIAYEILTGKRPGDLKPVTPRKLPLVLNLRSARGMGIRIPGKIVEGAEEVYE